MNTLAIQNLITFLGFLISVPIIIFVLFYHKIMSFLKPHLYCEIEMIERDNNIVNWLQRKNSDLTFRFNNGSYNMFDNISTIEENTNPQLPPLIRVFSSIYRKGRLTKLFYKEGDSNPIDMRNLKIVNDAQQSNQLEKIKISRLLNSGQNLANELFEKYGFWILCLILIIVIIIVFKSNGCPIPKTTTGA